MDLHHLLLAGLPAHSGLPRPPDIVRLPDWSGSCREETHARQQVGRWSAGELGAPVLPLVRPWQYDLELREDSGLRLDIDAAAMLFHDDVVAHRQAEPGTFARGFGCKERVEYLRFDLFRDTGSIIANTDFNLVSKVLGRSGKHCLVAIIEVRFSVRRGVGAGLHE